MERTHAHVPRGDTCPCSSGQRARLPGQEPQVPPNKHDEPPGHPEPQLTEPWRLLLVWPCPNGVTGVDTTVRLMWGWDSV